MMRPGQQFSASSAFCTSSPVKKPGEQACGNRLLPRSLYLANALRWCVSAKTMCYTDVLPALAAFFSRAASFFCLLDFGAAFCSFFCFCSLFAMEQFLPFK